MKPLLLTPVYKDYIWGGEKLVKEYGKETDLRPVAESWELSCHHDGLTIIRGGEFDGMTLCEYIKNHTGCLGTDSPSEELPILIKLIDACDKLSVQVHPNDEQAKTWENQNGKTEMWYVVDAEEDAKITYGVKKEITKDELRKSIENNTVEELLNTVNSKKGDVFFVEAGTIHAIGKGNLIAEIQQNSNVTYRLYDYARVGKDGKLRPLHIEKGVEASVLTPPKSREIKTLNDGTHLIGECEYFSVRELKLEGSYSSIAYNKSYVALLVADGGLTLESEDFSQNLSKGETVFIPAGLGEFGLNGKATLLITTNKKDN